MRDLVSTLVLLAALQGAVLALVLWRRDANRLANRLLAALVALVVLMLVFAEIEPRWGSRNPHLLGLAAPLPFLFGPLLYLYVIALTRPVRRPDPRWLAHALPFVGDALYLAQVFYFEAPAAKLALARASASGDVPASFRVVIAFLVVQALTYVGLAWRALDRYGRKVHGFFSDLTDIDLRWLRVLVAAHAVVWTVVLVTTALRWLGIPSAAALGSLVQLASALAIFLTGYISLWQRDLSREATAAQVADPSPPAVAEPPPGPPEAPALAARPEPDAPDAATQLQPPARIALVRATPDAARPTLPKYQRNRLDDDEARQLLARLEELMHSRRLYRDPDLTLPALADALGITPHMLSQLLNVRIGKSFFAYVNGRRADALMAALADPREADRGVLDLAFEVGFSSKSTLNGFFKKHAGATPTEFRARALAQKSVVKSHG